MPPDLFIFSSISLVRTRWNEVSCSCCIIPIWLTTAARIGPIASFRKKEASIPSHHLTVFFLNTIHNHTNSPEYDSITYGFSTMGVCFCDKKVGLSGLMSIGSKVARNCREGKRIRWARGQFLPSICSHPVGTGSKQPIIWVITSYCVEFLCIVSYA